MNLFWRRTLYAQTNQVKVDSGDTLLRVGTIKGAFFFLRTEAREMGRRGTVFSRALVLRPGIRRTQRSQTGSGPR